MSAQSVGSPFGGSDAYVVHSVAYCGPPPIPEDTWIRWNFDPYLLVGMVLVAYFVYSGRTARANAGWGAVGLAFIVFVSPLCALSSALFSARVLHHLLLIGGVAPLLAMAFPVIRTPRIPLAMLVAIHAVILWIWHAPVPYAWGLSTVSAYWLMQASLLISSWLLWREVLAPETAPGAAIGALAVTIGQMGLLGAVIFFASSPLYEIHSTTTQPWGLSPLADQQLAGLLMWVPAIIPYALVGLWLMWSSLRPVNPAR